MLTGIYPAAAVKEEEVVEVEEDVVVVEEDVVEEDGIAVDKDSSEDGDGEAGALPGIVLSDIVSAVNRSIGKVIAAYI